MGSRGRSIRLRIYFLVAIPLVTMIGLLSYVVTTSINNAVNLDRAPSLINATSVPASTFVGYLQNERLRAVNYLFQPTPANLQLYQNAINATDANEPVFIGKMESPATRQNATASSLQTIQLIIDSINQLPKLREGVKARLLGPGQPMTALAGLQAYSQGIQAEPKLFLAEAASMTDATAASQALGLIAMVSVHEALSQEQALLTGMLGAQKASQADRTAFTELAATRAGDLVDAQAILSPANMAVYNAALKGSEPLQNQLTQLEGAIAAGVPIARLPITQAQAEQLIGTLIQGYLKGGLNDAQAQLTVDSHTTRAAWVRVGLTSGIAFLGLLLTILVTTLVGRGIIRRLRGLETTALTLAEDQLPDVVGRLRRGDEVDVAAEAPPLRVGGDEIGRVGQAFDLVRQTAIRAAVDEAKLRRGLNDVFRSLARRSQSLLHRQLTLLDQMERRASDPEALDDLFRLDHLTTRMRRHAEGLVILAGAPPGRAWSSPVRMVDVMRGAIAEVEDYARVSVATRSQAALSGSAVADVIHLLAELIENATTLSPPYTSVRLSGDTVANGFAIEVEDRGLGMSEQRLAELNERLANPPEFNPSDSEQLGLFVVGQLAKRHGIRVTLKASPYGGTEAVVLIPRHLVVAEEAFRASLPGETAAAITGGAGGSNGPTGPVPANGNHFAPGLAGSAAPPGFGDLDVPFEPGSQITGGPRISGALRRAHGTIPDGRHHASRPKANGGTANGKNGNGNGFGARLGPSGSDVPQADPGQQADLTPKAGFGAPDAGFEGPDGGFGPPDAGFGTASGELPRRNRGGRPPATPEPPAAASPAAASRTVVPPAAAPSTGGSSPFGPAPTPFGTGEAPYGPSEKTSFPGWPGQSAPRTPTAPMTPMTPVTSGGGAGAGSPDNVSRPPWELSPDTGPIPVIPGTAETVTEHGDGATDDDFKGLPRRVKQANLAPQLRAEPVTRVGRAGASGGNLGTSNAGTSNAGTSNAGTSNAGNAGAGDTGGAGQPGGPSPSEIRATMSALQRGWQEGRAQRASRGEPPWERESAAEEEPDGA